MNRPIFFPSYEHLDNWIAALQPALLAERFGLVVGILRGGAPLALMVSHATGVPVAFIRYDRPTATVAWDSSLPLPPAGTKVLLCEDIAGRGRTLVDCLAFLQGHHLEVRTLTAAYDELSRIRPDYGIDACGRTVTFPWDRHVFTEAYRSDWERTESGRVGALRADHEYAVVGIDLDGILLADIPAIHYETDLAAALAARDQLLPLPTLPDFDRTSATIITGRPEHDRNRTEKWLIEHGFGALPLVLRDPTRYPDGSAGAAAHKADAAVRLGCTVFIESDLPQAVEIALRVPLLRVVWWHGETGRGTLVGAQPWGTEASKSIPNSSAQATRDAVHRAIDSTPEDPTR